MIVHDSVHWNKQMPLPVEQCRGSNHLFFWFERRNEFDAVERKYACLIRYSVYGTCAKAFMFYMSKTMTEKKNHKNFKVSTGYKPGTGHDHCNRLDTALQENCQAMNNY